VPAQNRGPVPRSARNAARVARAAGEGPHRKDPALRLEPPPLLSFRADAATVKKSAVNSLLLQLLLRLKGIITLPIITWLMLPEELGVFNLVVNTAGFLIPLFTLNLIDGPVIYFVKETDTARISRMYSTVFHATWLASAAGFLLAWPLAAFCPSLAYLEPYVLLGILAYLSLYAFKVTSYLLVIYQKTQRMLLYSAWNEISGVVLGILLLALGWSYRGLVVGNFLAGAALGGWILKLLLREIRLVPRVDREDLRRFLRVSLPLLPVFFFTWVMQSLDAYFLAYFHGTEAVGRYAVVYSICRIILATSMALNFFWYPVSVRMWQEDRERYLRYFRLLFSHGLLALFFLLLLLDANSRLIVSVFARGPEYQSVYPYLSLIAFAFTMQVLITVLTAPLYANEKPRWILASSLAGGLTSLAMNLLLIPRFGILGASITAACSFLVVVLMLAGGTYRFCGFRFLEKRCLASLPFAFGLWAALALLREQLSRAGGLGVSALLTAVSLPAVYGLFFSERERKFVRENAGRFLSLGLRSRKGQNGSS